MGIREEAGRVVGGLLAPVAAAVAHVRGARVFHPEGIVYRALVVPLAETPPYADLAWRLSGEALVRLSTAWWRGGKEWLDALGLAVRFRSEAEPSAEPAPRDQDLLFATIRWPWTTLLAPFTTEQHDFLRNDFHAVSPFVVDGFGRAKWRLVSPQVALEGRDRTERLERAVDRGLARFRLQVRRLERGSPWVTVAEVRLRERVDLDQERLRFSPFRAGRGIHPAGLVQAMRRATYAASQRARPKSDGLPHADEHHPALSLRRRRPQSQPPPEQLH